MIDLSHLTEEEQEMILSVLKRDSDLKHAEEQRIKKLQKTEHDRCKLKYLTGEWFYETKSNRYRDKKHACDIIKASMERRKPVTIMELTQIWPGKSSVSKKPNKELFIPPELCGLIGEAASAGHDNGEDHFSEYKPSTNPQIKPRQNPFNSKPIQVESPLKTDRHTQSGAAIQQIPLISYQVPADQRPAAASLSSLSKPCQAPEIPAEGSNKDPKTIRTAQKQACVRPLSLSKSLEDLATVPSNDRRKNEPRVGVIQTVDEASDSLSISVLDPEKSKRLSVSVPAFMHEQGNGGESDCLSVNSFYSERQRKSSTNTNISASSGLASMSSVSGSVSNIYGTDFGHVDVKGNIQFAINYVNKLGELHIFIVQCRDLAIAEPKRNRSDPYVKCYLLPDKAKLGKRKTSVKKKTLDPIYNEILRYKTPLESLKVQTLNISVWHHDTFGRNSFLGEANVDLSDWDNNTHLMDFPLKGRTATPSSPKHISPIMEMCGDIRISLRFLLQTSQSDNKSHKGEIQVWVKECTNLPFKRGTVDPFVKCSIFPDNHEKNRQKTRVVKRNANPVFNHIMVYEGLGPEDLQDTCVELTVWNHDRLSNHFLGGARLSLGTGKCRGAEVKWMDSNSVESELWRRMIESKYEWVEDIVPLRMFIMAR